MCHVFMYYIHYINIMCAIFFIYYFIPSSCEFFQATRSVSLFPVVSLMCNTLRCNQAEQLVSAGNDEFGFTHISEPLHLSLSGSNKRVKCIW